MTNKKTRNRSVKLDLKKVRDLAANKGWKRLHDLEAAYHHYKGLATDANTPSAPKQAWDGERIDRNKAIDIALFLGVSDYTALLYNTPADIIFPKQLSWEANFSPPGALLKAEYGIVPFHHRQAELDDLDNWCNVDERLGIRLYSGAGGMGKTRLSIEQCLRLKKQKKSQWEAGFLHYAPSQNQQVRFQWLELEHRPIFIVIDYAETRQEEVIAFLQASLRAKIKIRVLLLARAAADWWAQLKTENQGVGDLLMSPTASWILLQPMLLDAQAKEESWFLATDAFAHHLQQTIIDKVPQTIDLSAHNFERVLLLHMQALLSVEQQHSGDSQQEILEVTLNRERYFWAKQLEARGLPKIFQQAISTAMARITLIGGIRQVQDINRVLDNITILADSKAHERQAIFQLLQNMYPCTQSVDNKTNRKAILIEPLQPDLLGEHLLQAELKLNEQSILDFAFYNCN